MGSGRRLPRRLGSRFITYFCGYFTTETNNSLSMIFSLDLAALEDEKKGKATRCGFVASWSTFRTRSLRADQN